MTGRYNCRKLCVILLGIRRFNYSHPMQSNAKEVIKMIVAHVWKNRFLPVWRPFPNLGVHSKHRAL